MTFKGIRDELLNIAGQDGGGKFETMVDKAINRTYRRLLVEVNQDETRRKFALATVSGTSEYGLPLNVLRIQNMFDSTSSRRLKEISAQEFDERYARTLSSGTPSEYYVLGTFGVQAQPTSAGVVAISSDSAADATDFFVRIQGLDANGVWITEQVTANGTSGVTTTASFTTIESVAKSANSGFEWTGQLTVSQGATVLTRIPKAVTSPNHLWIGFNRTPGSVINYDVRSMARKPDLLNDDDWPQIQEDFHQLLVDGPGPELMLAAGKPQQAQRMQADFDVLLPVFKARAQYRPNKVGIFKDVQSNPRGIADDRPIIEGVDFV